MDPEPAFWPDQAPAQSGGRSHDDLAVHPDGERPARPRAGMAPRVGVVVIACALLTGALVVMHVGPFSSSPGIASTPSVTASAPPDIRGAYSSLVGFASSLSSEPMEVSNENLSTGAFTATIMSPIGVEAMNGTVVGSTMTFTISLGTSTDRGSASVSTTAGKLRIQGVFSNSKGGQGTILATRTSR